MSDNLPPLIFRWKAEQGAMIAVSKRADSFFLDGEYYRLEAREERSSKHHAWFFVKVSETWKSLPEDWGNRFPSPDHLRKWALVHTGHCDERVIACSSREQAKEIVSMVRSMDGFAVIAIGKEDDVVRIYTAKSQSFKSMNNDEFKKSADDVIAFLADKIGVRPSDIPRRESA